MISVFIKREETQTHEAGTPHDDEGTLLKCGRDKPRNSKGCQQIIRTQEEARKGFPPQDSEGARPCQHLDF